MFGAAKKEAELSQVISETLMEKERLVSVLAARCEMRFQRDESGWIWDRVFAEANKSGRGEGELFCEGGIIGLRFDGYPFEIGEPGSGVVFNVTVGEKNADATRWRGI